MNEECRKVIERLVREVGEKCKVLLLHDLAGTLCWRGNNIPTGPNGETNQSYVIRKKRWIYVRPGAFEYIQRL